MILIADSGSTKTDWVLTDRDKIKFRYSTIGYNPYFTDADNIYSSISQTLIPKFDASIVRKIFFYGAGCSTSENVSVVYKALSKCFGNSEVLVAHDMLAAARALLGTHRGFAAIIGTGSNTCVYDGAEIETNIDSLGYLLGDEGSGSHIGKKIIRDFMRGYLPCELHKKFKEMYHLSHADVFDSMYNKPSPNRFLASFCTFADEHKQHSYIQNIVKESFNDFFKNLVSKYHGYEEFSFNCVGSVAYIFKDLLTEVSESYKMKAGKIIPSPIEGLVNYHIKL